MTIKEREARSVLQLARKREGSQARNGNARSSPPPNSPVRRSRQTAHAQDEFVRRVRSYLEVPRG